MTPITLASGITIKSFTGSTAKNYLAEIAQLSLDRYAQYPYLIYSTISQEFQAFEHYFKSNSSNILLAFNDSDQVIGCSIALCIQDELTPIKSPFENHPHFSKHLKSLFYIADMIIDEAYEGKKITSNFFNLQETYAKQAGYQESIIMTIIRSPNDPQQPVNYKSNDPIWRHMGYVPILGLQTTLSWIESHSMKNAPHSLQFWSKPLR